MSRLVTRMVLTIALGALVQTNVFATCWYIEVKGCSEPDNSCGTNACEEEFGEAYCYTTEGTFSNFGSYDHARPALGSVERDLGGTSHQKGTGYIYCVQATQCNTEDPCPGNGYCVADGGQSNYGSPTYDDELVPGNPCP